MSEDFGRNEDFGAVSFEGVTYTLIEQAEYTNRQLSAVKGAGWYDDKKYFELSAAAVNPDGYEVIVYWIFAYRFDRFGEPAELDTYDYSKPDRVEET